MRGQMNYRDLGVSFLASPSAKSLHFVHVADEPVYQANRALIAMMEDAGPMIIKQSPHVCCLSVGHVFETLTIKEKFYSHHLSR